MSRRFATDFDTQDLGPASGYTCPDCHGSLVALGEANFRCRVGYAWTPEALLTARDTEVEQAMWVAVRSLQEQAKLARQLASGVRAGMLARRYSEMAAEAEQALAVLSSRMSELSRTTGEGGE